MEKTELVKQICRVLEYSQNCIYDADEMKYIKNFVDEWYEKKQYFINEWFNGELIYELPEPVTFTLTPQEQERQFDNFINTVFDYYGQSELGHFINQRVSRDEFFKNRFDKDFEYDSYKFLKGSKVIKAFKHFITRANLISEIQDKASEIIQCTKVTGTFCFSVHPLDFMSASENAHNWRSCHALDGDYRSGNMSYLLDNATIMCYLKAPGGDTYKLPHFPPDIPWNSKKWRMWLFFSNDRELVMTGREYPFSSETSLDIVKNFFTREKNITWTNWYDKFVREYDCGNGEPIWTLKRYLPLGEHDLIAMNTLVEDYSPDPIYYNDLLLSEHYRPKWMYRMYDNYWFVHRGTSRQTRIKVGGEYHCPVCGREVTQGWNMFCKWCNDDSDEEEEDDCFTCDICGQTYNANNEEYLILPLSGTIVCRHCYNDDEYLATCEECGTRDVKEYVNFNNDKNKKKCLCYDCRTTKEELPTDNNMVWIMPSNENRPIKITFEGSPIISSYDTRGEN